MLNQNECSRDGLIAYMDMHGCGKLGRKYGGGARVTLPLMPPLKPLTVHHLLEMMMKNVNAAFNFRHIFCNAFRKGVYGNKYQWLIVGMYDDNWWMKEGPCKPEEIQKALVGAMIMDILPLASSEDITVSKRVSF